MSDCFRNYYIYNSQIKNIITFTLPKNFIFNIYEVIRIVKGIPLFLEDHLRRLRESCKLKGVVIFFNNDFIINDIKKLIEYNSNIDGNIRYDIFFLNNSILRISYFIRHYYPEPYYYKNGVNLLTINSERPIPNIKLFDKKLKLHFEKVLKNKNVYEVLLTNNKWVTEGSRSNIFFIKENILYTAEDKNVLKGITRKKVLEILKELNIPLIKKRISLFELELFQSAFLTGTSSKILPVRKINNFNFDPSNQLIKSISQKYDQKISNYISEKILK